MQGRAYDVRAGDVGQWDSMCRRRNVVGGDVGDMRDRGEDDVELSREEVEFLLGDRQPGKVGQMCNVIARDGGHAVAVMQGELLERGRTAGHGCSSVGSRFDRSL